MRFRGGRCGGAAERLWRSVASVTAVRYVRLSANAFVVFVSEYTVIYFPDTPLLLQSYHSQLRAAHALAVTGWLMQSGRSMHFPH